MKIIALDGPDGSGKTTQVHLLGDYLSIDLNKRIEKLQMPGGSALGRQLRALVKSKEYSPCPMTERLMFLADTVQCFWEHLDAAREQPDFLVVDRWSPFTDAVYGQASGVPLETILKFQEAAGVVRQCDLLFLFQAPFDLIWARKQLSAGGGVPRAVSFAKPDQTDTGACRIEAKGEQFLRRVTEIYNEFCADVLPGGECTERRANNLAFTDWRAKRTVVIDATQSRDDIKRKIQEEVKLLV